NAGVHAARAGRPVASAQLLSRGAAGQGAGRLPRTHPPRGGRGRRRGGGLRRKPVPSAIRQDGASRPGDGGARALATVCRGRGGRGQRRAAVSCGLGTAVGQVGRTASGPTRLVGGAAGDVRRGPAAVRSPTPAPTGALADRGGPRAAGDHPQEITYRGGVIL